MNLAQLVRKARLGVDGIFPSGQVSSLWKEDEMVDLVDQSNNDINTKLRLAGKKWMVQSMGAITPPLGTATGAGIDVVTTPITRDGETYDPTTNLALQAGQTRALLPPDFGEMVKIETINQTTSRWVKGDYESEYWTDLEQNARNTDGSFVTINSAFGQTMYYDILDRRTLATCPPVPATMQIQIDYIPMKRPLRYSTPGSSGSGIGTVTLTNGSTAVVGNGTTWITDNIYTEASNQFAELVWFPVGTAIPAANAGALSVAVRLDFDYPRVQSLQSDTLATLVSPWTLATGNYPAIMAMAPTTPRIYHQWIAELTTTFMLRKVNPDVSDKYAQAVLGRFDTIIRPSAGRRSGQTSTITDDETLMGGLADR